MQKQWRLSQENAWLWIRTELVEPGSHTNERKELACLRRCLYEIMHWPTCKDLNHDLKRTRVIPLLGTAVNKQWQTSLSLDKREFFSKMHKTTNRNYSQVQYIRTSYTMLLTNIWVLECITVFFFLAFTMPSMFFPPCLHDGGDFRDRTLMFVIFAA